MSLANISEYFGLFSTGIGIGILLGGIFVFIGIFVGSFIGIMSRG